MLSHEPAGSALSEEQANDGNMVVQSCRQSQESVSDGQTLVSSESSNAVNQSKKDSKSKESL